MQYETRIVIEPFDGPWSKWAWSVQRRTLGTGLEGRRPYGIWYVDVGSGLARTKEAAERKARAALAAEKREYARRNAAMQKRLDYQTYKKQNTITIAVEED